MNYSLPTKTSLSLACALLASTSANADTPPDPFLGNRHLLTVKFNVSRPVTETEAQFLAVRQLMNTIDDETVGAAEHHPEKHVSCDQCHATDSVSVDHYGLTINEANPEKSCAKVGCHDLKVAGEMPFYVKPFASLDESKKSKQMKQRLTAAKNLLHYAQDFKEHLLARTTELPTLSSFSIDIEAEDKKINNLTHDTPLTFFEPKTAFEVKQDADVLPLYASKGLASNIFATLDQSPSVATRLNGALEARIKSAEELEKHLSILDDHTAINHLLTNSQLILRYLATLPDDSIDFLANELAATFPLAAIKTDTTTGDDTSGRRRSKSWEIPAEANDGKTAATITLQLNSEGLRTQPSTQLQFQRLSANLRSSAVQVLKRFQEHYSDFNNDHARYTLTYQANSEADKTLLTASIQTNTATSSQGDLRRTLTFSENTTTGTLSTTDMAAQSADAIQAAALANPATIRRLRSNIRYKADLTSVSQISNEVLTASLPRISITTQQQQLSENSKEKILFSVARESAADKPLTVYLNINGTASAGKDYVKPKLSVTIPAKASSVIVPVKLINNRAVEATETLKLIAAPSKTNNYSILKEGSQTVSILDDDVR